MRLKTMRTAGPKVPGRIVTEPENCWKGWGTVNLYASTSTSRTEPPSGSPRSLPVQLTGRVIGVAVASVLPASAPVPQSFCGGRGTTVITADMLPVGSVAVMVTGVGALTGKGMMSNCPSVEPARTVTVAGTVAARGSLPESPTVTSDVAIAVTLANPCIVVTNREVSTAGGGAPFAARAGAAEPARSVSTARAANARARTPARRPLLAPSFGDASAPLSPLRRMGAPPLVRLVSCAARPHTPAGQAQCHARRRGELWPRKLSPTVWVVRRPALPVGVETCSPTRALAAFSELWRKPVSARPPRRASHVPPGAGCQAPPRWPSHEVLAGKRSVPELESRPGTENRPNTVAPTTAKTVGVIRLVRWYSFQSISVRSLLAQSNNDI